MDKRSDSEAAVAILIPNPPQPTLRTLSSVRAQVAREIAIRAISKATTLDGVRIGIVDASSASSPTDEPFFHLISQALTSTLALQSYLFFISSTVTSPAPNAPGILLIVSSSQDLITRAVLLTSAKFTGRILNSYYPVAPDDDSYDQFEVPSSPNTESTSRHRPVQQLRFPIEKKQWLALINNLNVSPLDTHLLQDILSKAARTPLDLTLPPPGSKGIDQILDEARVKLQRITPRQALTELRDNPIGAPTFLVDIRPQAQREEEGTIKGALIIERNVLEWRFDPRHDSRLPIVDRYDLRIILFCQEGYTSSLAAYSLQQIGMLNATDIVGGYKAWKDAGLPVELKPSRQRSLASLAGSLV